MSLDRGEFGKVCAAAGRRNERAEIVAWLRAGASNPIAEDIMRDLAAAIERGEHEEF